MWGRARPVPKSGGDGHMIMMGRVLSEARFPAKRNATDCVRKVRKKRKKITQSKTLRKTRFPSKRNERNAASQ